MHRPVLAYSRPTIANYVGKAENKSHGDVQASIYLVMQAYIGIVGPICLTGVTIILRYPFSSLFDDDPT